MLSQSSNRSFHPLSLVHAPLAGRGLCSSLLVLLALGAVSNSWAGDCNIVVGSTADSGGTCTTYPAAPDATCTLRQAIDTANSGDTICFAAGMKGQTITLTTQSDSINYPGTALLVNGKDLTISGYGNGVIIDGNQSLRIFYFKDNMVELNGLILQKGRTFSTDQGAAVYADAGILTVRDSTFKENLSAYDGGAIYNTNANILTIMRSTFNDNEASQTAAGRGGAVYSAAGTISIYNSTFYNNKASDGGGIYTATGSRYTVTITNNTFAKNQILSTGSGGGIFIQGGATLKNNIFTDSVNNLGASVDDCYKNTLAINSGINNLIVRQSTVSENKCLAISGTNVDNSGTNLNLTLGNNGGPTQTAAINSTMTAAYNTGDNATCAFTTTVNKIDQRGVTRPQYGTCDKGAYEASARAGSLKLKLVKKGQCKTPCSGNDSLTYPPDTAYPQLSLKGVCWAYVNLQNITGSTTEGARDLTNITTELVSVTNNNWVLNTNTIPMQGGGAVLIEPTPSGCTDSGIPTPTGNASLLEPGQTINVWYKVGMMNAGPYVLNTKLFLTDPAASAMSFGSSNSMPVVIEELGEFTVDFNSQEEQGDAGDAPQEGALLPPILKPIDSGFIKRVLAK